MLRHIWGLCNNYVTGNHTVDIVYCNKEHHSQIGLRASSKGLLNVNDDTDRQFSQLYENPIPNIGLRHLCHLVEFIEFSIDGSMKWITLIHLI